MQENSLGNSYKLYPVLVQEIIHQYRNNILSFEQWQNCDPIDINGYLSFYSWNNLYHIAYHEIKGKFGVPSNKNSYLNNRYILLVGSKNAYTESIFGVTDGQVIFIHPNIFFYCPFEFFKGAKLIIFACDVFAELYSLSKQMIKFNIPYFYFIHDDLLNDNYTLYDSINNKNEETKKFLCNAKGVISTTLVISERLKKFDSNIRIIDNILKCTFTSSLKNQICYFRYLFSKINKIDKKNLLFYVKLILKKLKNSELSK